MALQRKLGLPTDQRRAIAIRGWYLFLLLTSTSNLRLRIDLVSSGRDSTSHSFDIQVLTPNRGRIHRFSAIHPPSMRSSQTKSGISTPCSYTR